MKKFFSIIGFILISVLVFAGGGEDPPEIFAIDGNGAVLKSSDLGVSWTHVNPGYEVTSPKEIVSDSNGNLYILTDQSEIAKSSDGGVTWAIVKSDYNGSETSSLWVTMTYSKTNDFLFIIEKSGDDVWRSADGGENWIKVNDDYNGSVNPRPKGAAVDANGNLFVVDENADVWKSIDNGEAWAKINDDYNGSRNNYAADYIIGDGNHYIVMGVGGSSYVYKSTDEGYTFEDMGKVTQYGAVDAMTFAQGIIYAAVNYGNKAPDAHRSEDGAASWTLSGEIANVNKVISMTSITYAGNALNIEWIDIPEGSFLMGDNFDSNDPSTRDNMDEIVDEKPVHQVYLSAYKISKYEVTFDQYDAFCDDTGRAKPDDNGWGRGNLPVINVNWFDAQAFCDWLSQKTGENIHLPTEAQWEKAAKGTEPIIYPWGNTAPSCDNVNYNYCNGKTMPVVSYPSGVSPYGVYNMAGNVWTWCSDWYSSTYYTPEDKTDPTGPSSGQFRVMRGGSWPAPGGFMRTSNRDYKYPFNSNYSIGIRLVQD